MPRPRLVLAAVLAFAAAAAATTAPAVAAGKRSTTTRKGAAKTTAAKTTAAKATAKPTAPKATQNTTSAPTPSPTKPTPTLSGRLTVFAASSLTEAFTAAANAFEKRYPGTNVEVSFGGSPTLVTQVINGAPAGVIALADLPNMSRLQQAGAVETPVAFAGNKLAIVVRRTNPRGITKLADLTRPGLLIGLGGPAVPVGAYARQAFARAGLEVPSASQEQDVKAIVTKVALGELDAGIVYVTDVQAGEDQVLGVDIPENQNIVATYPAAVVRGTGNAPFAQAFLNWLRSGEGQRLVTSFGFLPAG